MCHYEEIHVQHSLIAIHHMLVLYEYYLKKNVIFNYQVNHLFGGAASLDYRILYNT